MPQEIYRIRQAIIIPLGIALIALMALLVLSSLKKSLPGERFVLVAVWVFVLYLFLEVLARRVSFRNGGLEIRKFLRKKEFTWDEITHVGHIIMGKKIYILLTTTRGFYIISNNYDRFSLMIDKLIRGLSEERVDGEVRNVMKNPPINNKPVYSSWGMVVMVIAVGALRLFIR